MTTKPTAGPWHTLPEECDKPYIRVRGTQLGGRYKVANVLTPVYEGVSQREAEETRANAHLIAAAPELLEALETVVAEWDALYPSFPTDTKIEDAEFSGFQMARAAIAKARGAQ